MARCVLAFLFLAVLSPGVLVAQTATWQAHPSLRQATGIASSATDLWVATTGGVYRYAPSSGEVKRFSPAEGLNAPDTSTVAYDAVRDAAWVGFRNGVLNRIDAQTDVVTSFLDISRAEQFAQRGINKIVVRGDSLLIATGFGIVVFDAVRGEVRDAYTRFANYTRGIAAFDALVAPLPDGRTGLWVATSAGLAYAPLNGVNLQDPSVWRTESVADEPMSVFALAYFENRLYAGTSVDIRVREGADSYLRLGLTGSAARFLYTTPSAVYGTEQFRMLSITATTNTGHTSDVFQTPRAVTLGPDGNVWLADLEQGVVRIQPPSETTLTVEATFIPAGPYHRDFSDLTIDAEGNLWASAAVRDGGIYRRTPEDAWTSLNRITEPSLGDNNNYTKIYTPPDGTVWAASEGDGVLRRMQDGTLTAFNASNSSLLDATGSTNFIIAGGAAQDRAGNTWVTTRASRRALHVLQTDETWTALTPYVGDGLGTTASAYGDIFIDSFDQKWIIVRNESNLRLTKGLLVVDTGTTPTDQSDDNFRFFGTEGGSGSGLPSIGINAVVEDNDGLIWLATDNGIAFMLNNGIVAQDPSALPIWPARANRQQGEDPYLLRGLQVNDIAIDPANRIWAATNEGAFLARAVEGGYVIDTQFTASNSPLLSNTVLDVAVSPTSGRVFFSTDRGLISYQGDAVQPATEVQDLFVYPNPVHLSATDAPTIFIEGLVDDTDVRILTITGDVVAQVPARGGRIRWNGRDRTNALVPSGMYLVVAVSNAGEGAAYGKIAVIR
ncbi:MAG: two-component regulator propeller domain-containing protein [Rhodothermales bacterium]